MNYKSNRQAQKTELALQNTLIELLRNKSIEKITVAEISESAGIHRGTFYLHHSDVYDLFHSIENGFLDKFNILFQNYLHSEPLDFADFSLNMYKHFISYPKISHALLYTKQSKLIDRMSVMGSPSDFKVWQSRFKVGNKDNYKYYFSSLTSALNSLIFTWFESGFSISPEELAEIAQKLFMSFNPILVSKGK